MYHCCVCLLLAIGRRSARRHNAQTKYCHKVWCASSLLAQVLRALCRTVVRACAGFAHCALRPAEGAGRTSSDSNYSLTAAAATANVAVYVLLSFVTARASATLSKVLLVVKTDEFVAVISLHDRNERMLPHWQQSRPDVSLLQIKSQMICNLITSVAM